MLLSRDTLLVSAKIRRKESLADGELLPFARICRKETLAELQPDGELSGFCCNAWKTSTHPCGVSTHVFLSSGNFTISPQRISKTSCLQIYKPSHRKSSCNVSQGTARRCSSLPFQGVGDNLFHLWGGSGTIWTGTRPSWLSTFSCLFAICHGCNNEINEIFTRSFFRFGTKTLWRCARRWESQWLTSTATHSITLKSERSDLQKTKIVICVHIII